MPRVNHFELNKFGNRLLRQLRDNTQTVMNSVGKDVARREMTNTIEQKVYKNYTPAEYRRRKTKGGLTDPDNIETRVYKAFDGELTELGYEMSITLSVGNKAKRTIVTKSKNGGRFRSRKIIKKYTDDDGNVINDGDTDDLLYLWKDQGYVYDLFSSPNFRKYGKPLHLNETLSKKMIAQVRHGEIDKALLQKYQGVCYSVKKK